ncbi:MAG TPA: NAD-dependent epimerase/dehydratase family protein [Gemmatimonadaceae bacterium]|nr:NAD-dependent epimerase/dehydratase family protein [Gemmatimonadaceae bacterium]
MIAAATATPRSEEELDELLSRPRDATIATLRRTPGDVIILGAGGKMGPTLARMAARAAAVADAGKPHARRIIAVSRFSSSRAADALVQNGIEVIAADLLDAAAVARLPDAPNVIFMAGQKFGTADAPSRTWMMNVVVPAHCAERFAGSRIVAFSTGNVYPLVPATGGGATEGTTPAPVGEYAASCLGRERMFEHFAATRGTHVAIVRLNYAIDLRYGVLTDIAQRVWRGTPVPIAMGFVNVIWQGDANRVALELLPHASNPPYTLNLTGTELLSVRSLASQLGMRLGREPRFEGSEATDALLSNTARMRETFGYPETRLDLMLDWVADWVREGRPLLGKPTHFEARDGAY